MSDISLQELAKKMQHIDFTMLATVAAHGGVTSRPMSNNGDVAFDGDAYFFTYLDSGKVRDIRKNPAVTTTYRQEPADKDGAGLFISVDGKAEVVTDKDSMAEHWFEGLKEWFPDGLETEGICMLKVHASHVRWWESEDGGEITVQ